MEIVKFWGFFAGMLVFTGWLVTKLPMLAIPLAVFWIWFAMILVGATGAALAEWWHRHV